jgi:hypothetical protein
MASSNLVLDSQHGHIATSKPFPFLDLPGEIRNKIYEFIIRSRDPIIRLKKVHRGTDAHSFFGLANTNKKLRAEFGPLLMSGIRFHVQLLDYPAFVAFFFGPDFQFSRPLRVQIKVENRVQHTFSWDMKPLILAKATTPGLDLMLYDHPYSRAELPNYNYISDLAWLIGGRVKGSPWQYTLYGASRALLRDIKSGYISDIRIRDVRYRGPAWYLVVRKKEGGLRNGEMWKFWNHCRILCNRAGGWDTILANVTIKVVDFQGKHVEEWFTRGWTQFLPTLDKKVGKEWWKIQF